MHEKTIAKANYQLSHDSQQVKNSSSMLIALCNEYNVYVAADRLQWCVLGLVFTVPCDNPWRSGAIFVYFCLRLILSLYKIIKNVYHVELQYCSTVSHMLWLQLICVWLALFGLTHPSQPVDLNLQIKKNNNCLFIWWKRYSNKCRDSPVQFDN